jgi:hypothetical protein
LEVGTPIYNIGGGPQSFDPQAILSFAEGAGPIIHDPEPSSIVLVAMAVLSLALTRQLRRR